jgi:hypothetical protein
MKALAFAVLTVIACQRSVTAPPPIHASTIAPMKLRYHGEHHGDHPSWIFTAHVSVAPDAYQGRPAWRRSYRFQDIGESNGTKIEGTILLDRETLAPLESDDTFGGQRSHLVFRPDRVEGTEQADDGRVTAVSLPVHGFVVTDVWKGLDVFLLGLPLRPGYRTRVQLLYDTDKPLRPFALSVEPPERVRVPAGEFTAFRVLLDPLDGDDRQRAIYHVRSDGPPLVVRKQYVVNPTTVGQVKRSIGVEELEAIEVN